jgi:hypothetical protein
MPAATLEQIARGAGRVLSRPIAQAIAADMSASQRLITEADPPRTAQLDRSGLDDLPGL